MYVGVSLHGWVKCRGLIPVCKHSWLMVLSSVLFSCREMSIVFMPFARHCTISRFSSSGRSFFSPRCIENCDLCNNMEHFFSRFPFNQDHPAN
ncbi:hypothetical protein SRHO_G00001130 [Serrasalmus rhombeus]